MPGVPPSQASSPADQFPRDQYARDQYARDPFPLHLARYPAASTGLPQATAVRVVKDINAYYDETVEEYVRRRHTELKNKSRKNNVIWPEIAAEIAQRRFKAPDLTDRQLRRIIYG